MNIISTEPPIASAIPPAEGGAVRSLAEGDLPAVAALFGTTFRPRRRAGGTSLEGYLKRVFLEHPWRDPRVDPLVFVERDGAVRGFIGVHPLQLTFRGETLLAAVAGSFMVERPEERPLAGARLMRSFLSGPQDVSLSESANAVSQRMWERLGGKTVVPYSMEFLRVFRPAGLALTIAAERAGALALARPLAMGVDAIACRVSSKLRPDTSVTGVRAVDASDAEIADVLPRLAASYAARPAWDRATLLWLLSHAAEKDRFGRLVRRVLLGRNDVPVAAYLYYVRANGVAMALQMAARADAVQATVGSLLSDTFQAGAVAVRGRVQPEFADALLRQRAVFVHVASTLAHSRRADLMAAIRSGDGLITGLAGEAWSQLIGGAFG